MEKTNLWKCEKIWELKVGNMKGVIDTTLFDKVWLTITKVQMFFVCGPVEFCTVA